MSRRVVALVVAGWFLAGAWSGTGAAYEGPMISTHSQYDDDIEIDEVVRILKQARISKALLSTRLKRPTEEVLEAARHYPGLVVPLARTKVRDYLGGTPGWSAYLENIRASKGFQGMQELLLFHAAKINRRGEMLAPEITVGAGEERVAQAIGVAGAKGWPVTLHHEFRYLGNQGGPRKQKFFAEMEALLRKHQNQAFTLTHMALLEREEVEALIQAHPNVYFQLSMTANVYRAQPFPWTFLFVEGGELGELQPAWERLLEAHPDRFLLAFDGVFAWSWRRDIVPEAQEWRAALGRLDEKAARRIAHENAERLWPALRR